jgi:cell division protein FtsI (penicillin-binding protein 3)
LEDSEKHGLKVTTVKHAFEMSSNVGVSRLIQRYYGENKKGAKFVQHLKDFNLDKMSGVDVQGETEPFIKEAYDAKYDWSGTTLPWMSIGYETALTPLQMLTFYNAVANDGEMMKPYLLSEIQRFGESIKTFKPTIVKRRIASKNTIAKAKEILEGVILNGTGKDLRTTKYNFAGKTGTAQVNYSKLREQDEKGYQASFAGYFPAERPIYSCIVVVYNPKQYGFYGAGVAGTVFREIADKAFTTKTELHQVLNRREKLAMKAQMLPQADAGTREDLDYLLDYLHFRYYTQSKKDYVSLKLGGDSLKIVDRNLPENVVPNVIGMRLKDALYLLENRGLKVGVNGYGVVKRQSVPPGARAVQGTYVALGLE